jgi:hypothetical protein
VGFVLTAQTAFATNTNTTMSTFGKPVETSGPSKCFKDATGDHTCVASIGTIPKCNIPLFPTINVNITGIDTTMVATSPNATDATNEHDFKYAFFWGVDDYNDSSTDDLVV